jgi:hypothetical protein
MIIERTETEVILRLPSDIDSFGLERIERYLKYIESTKGSESDEQRVNQIADESKARWWSENKHRFIK